MNTAIKKATFQQNPIVNGVNVSGLETNVDMNAEYDANYLAKLAAIIDKENENESVKIYKDHPLTISNSSDGNSALATKINDFVSEQSGGDLKFPATFLIPIYVASRGHYELLAITKDNRQSKDCKVVVFDSLTNTGNDSEELDQVFGLVKQAGLNVTRREKKRPLLQHSPEEGIGTVHCGAYVLENMRNICAVGIEDASNSYDYVARLGGHEEVEKRSLKLRSLDVARFAIEETRNPPEPGSPSIKPSGVSDDNYEAFKAKVENGVRQASQSQDSTSSARVSDAGSAQDQTSQSQDSTSGFRNIFSRLTSGVKAIFSRFTRAQDGKSGPVKKEADAAKKDKDAVKGDETFARNLERSEKMLYEIAQSCNRFYPGEALSESMNMTKKFLEISSDILKKNKGLNVGDAEFQFKFSKAASKDFFNLGKLQHILSTIVMNPSLTEFIKIAKVEDIEKMCSEQREKEKQSASTGFYYGAQASPYQQYSAAPIGPQAAGGFLMSSMPYYYASTMQSFPAMQSFPTFAPKSAEGFLTSSMPMPISYGWGMQSSSTFDSAAPTRVETTRNFSISIGGLSWGRTTQSTSVYDSTKPQNSPSNASASRLVAEIGRFRG